MSWITENPWPLVVICGAVATFFLMQAMRSGAARSWGLAVLFVVAAVGVYIVEQSIVTPAEEISAEVHELLAACKAGNAEEAVGFISNNNLLLKTAIGGGLAIVDIHDDVNISDLSVKMVAEDSRGISHFRANGTVSVRSASYERHVATRWEVTWQLEGEEWKIISIQRLNPITGEEMEMMKRSET